MTEERTAHIKAIRTRIANYTENIHCTPTLDTRIKCDASRSGLREALQQLTIDYWKPILFASRFSNSTEERYSNNELELLRVVSRKKKYFIYYLNGKEFPVKADHRALLSIQEHRSNKSNKSRLSRRVDRLLPFQFKIEQLAGAEMGIVDYFSRNPYQPAKSNSSYGEEFLVATLSKIQSDEKILQKRKKYIRQSIE